MVVTELEIMHFFPSLHNQEIKLYLSIDFTTSVRFNASN